MDTDQTSPISILFRKLVDLHVNLAAMKHVLKMSRISDSEGNLLDWKKAVEHHRDAINSSYPAETYLDVRSKLLSLKPECPELILLLTELAGLQIET